jgi:hypothetical protein
MSEHVKKFEYFNQPISNSLNENYYTNELDKIDTNSEYSPRIQIANGEGIGKTKWMSLNEESAEILIDWLSANFLTSANTGSEEIVKSKSDIMKDAADKLGYKYKDINLEDEKNI